MAPLSEYRCFSLAIQTSTMSASYKYAALASVQVLCIYQYIYKHSLTAFTQLTRCCGGRTTQMQVIVELGELSWG